MLAITRINYMQAIDIVMKYKRVRSDKAWLTRLYDLKAIILKIQGLHHRPHGEQPWRD